MFDFLRSMISEPTTKSRKASIPARQILPAAAVVRVAPATAVSPPRLTHTPASLAQAIRCPDILALVAFDHAAHCVTPFVGAFDSAFAEAVQKLPALVRDGCTDMAAGLMLANDLLASQPRGLLRRIWLLTDGYPNPADQPLWPQVERARRQYTNINTVGFGVPGKYDRELLERIAKATHNGRFSEAQTLNRLTAIFRDPARPRKPGSHRGEATVFVIDISGSMTSPMGAQRAIDVVVTAMIELIKYKQGMWS